MKRTLAAITTIVIVVGLAFTGVSAASADDVAAPTAPVASVAKPDTLQVTDSPSPSAKLPTPYPSATSTPDPATTPSPHPTPTLTSTPTASNGKCLPASAVEYAYEAASNSGSVTVKAQAFFSTLLCAPIYLTAASWKYTKAAVWPQVLDSSKTNNVIVDKVGTFVYGAAVSCGQGDIYARTGSFIVPTPTLSGPQPWEKFLSGMGLKTTSVGQTYVQSPVGCVQTLPVSNIVAGECYWESGQGASFKTITIQYDNRKSNVPVDFSIQSYPQYNVDNSAYDRTIESGQLVELKLPASRAEGISYTVLAAGTKTTLTVPSYEACPPIISTYPLVAPTPVSFIDTCGVAGDKVVIPTLTNEDHFEYSTAESTTLAGVRTVTVSAVPGERYGFGSDATTFWSHTFKTDAQNNCVAVRGDPEVVGQSCAVASDGVVSGYLTVAPVTGVQYTIHPVAPTGADITVTGSKTDVAPGDYLVIAMAKPGFILTGVTEWPRTVARNALDCGVPFEPPTLADLPSSVSWVGQSCSASATVSGYIAIDPTDFLSYFVGATQLVSARTAFAPGTYVVTVVAPPGDTIDGPSSYTATISKPGTSCGNINSQSLATLAFTGFDSGAGYFAVASALLMLGAGLVFTARRKARV